MRLGRSDPVFWFLPFSFPLECVCTLGTQFTCYLRHVKPFPIYQESCLILFKSTTKIRISLPGSWQNQSFFCFEFFQKNLILLLLLLLYVHMHMCTNVCYGICVDSRFCGVAVLRPTMSSRDHTQVISLTWQVFLSSELFYWPQVYFFPITPMNTALSNLKTSENEHI